MTTYTESNTTTAAPQRNAISWILSSGGAPLRRSVAIPVDGERNGGVHVVYRERRPATRPVELVTDPYSGSATRPAAWSTRDTQSREVIHPTATPLLTDRVRIVLQCIRDVLRSQARRDFIPIDHVEIGAFIDSEEDVKQVVVTQWVRLPAESALRYWDRLGAAMESLMRVLPPELAAILEDRIVVEVRWLDHSVSVRPD